MSLGNIGDLMKLMGQAGKIRENMAQMHERAAKQTVEGEAGGGMVKVTANGTGELLTVAIDPEALKDPETLGPLIAAAANAALRKSKEVLLAETRQALGGIDLPPGFMGT
jgi:DNA-binding YbaB/EbfC family protein